MKKVLTNILFAIYIVIAVLITVCLLSYNNFKTTVLGNNALVVVSDNTFGENYSKGDLLIVDCNEEIKIGEKVFYYTVFEQDVKLVIGEVKNVEEVTSTEKTYTLEDEHKISGEYVLGKADGVKTIKKVGTVLSVLESKWGFLFIIVLPALMAFIYQITVVVSEIVETKKSGNDEKK